MEEAEVPPESFVEPQVASSDQNEAGDAGCYGETDEDADREPVYEQFRSILRTRIHRCGEDVGRVQRDPYSAQPWPRVGVLQKEASGLVIPITAARDIDVPLRERITDVDNVSDVVADGQLTFPNAAVRVIWSDEERAP